VPRKAQNAMRDGHDGAQRWKLLPLDCHNCQFSAHVKAGTTPSQHGECHAPDMNVTLRDPASEGARARSALGRRQIRGAGSSRFYLPLSEENADDRGEPRRKPGSACLAGAGG